MSKYTGKYDFRDFLKDYYHDNYEKFFEDTGGKIWIKGLASKEYHETRIRNSAELILFYPYTVISDSKLKHKQFKQKLQTKPVKLYLDCSPLNSELILRNILNDKYGSSCFSPFSTKDIADSLGSLINLYRKVSSEHCENKIFG